MDGASSSEMLIGELAAATGVGVETLRFYERRGLLPEPPRSRTGYRLYDRDAVRRVRFILRAKDLGFTLSETSELLDLRVNDERTCGDVRAAALRKMVDVDGRIRELTHIRHALDRLIEACAANRTTGECPILDALEHEQGEGRRSHPMDRRTIELIYFEGCPHADEARDNLRMAALAEDLPPTWQEWDLTDGDVPNGFRGYGSPTILVDGVDVAGSEEAAEALACRREGAPTVETIRRALARVRD